MYGEDVVYGAWGRMDYGAAQPISAEATTGLFSLGSGILGLIGSGIQSGQQTEMAKIQADAQRKAAEAELQKAAIAQKSMIAQADAQKKRAEADSLLAQAQAAMAAGQGAAASVPVGVWIGAGVGGLALLALLGGGIYLATRK